MLAVLLYRYKKKKPNKSKIKDRRILVTQALYVGAREKNSITHLAS